MVPSPEAQAKTDPSRQSLCILVKARRMGDQVQDYQRFISICNDNFTPTYIHSQPKHPTSSKTSAGDKENQCTDSGQRKKKTQDMKEKLKDTVTEKDKDKREKKKDKKGGEQKIVQEKNSNL
ncbi:hypothetical protein M422DRAFT_262516 [Sphaerobolus stellatus SS14]|uniref:Uncharacterized protein n=1 Tax=Sphaerobolus stellatus (strain SS14) TaxID=990650 RepID=A0A0C9VCU5_SPHS4|nr:hypothetical protein M422DRAFT_262516 [Sphaerobolus stellatus SS14]